MIIPVLDIKDGLAVSGKSGNREEYQPLKTVFHSSSDPLKISKSLKKAGASKVYVADLDAIEGIGSNRDMVGEINRFLPVMLDCGASDLDSVSEALQVANNVIVATETLKNLADLDEIFFKVNREQVTISIDVLNNKILSKHLELDFKILKDCLEKLKPSMVIILDISNVGTESGINWQLMDYFNGLESSLILGGGITREDLPKLSMYGVDNVLVGTALHQGKIEPNF
ncbi:HisA/HisF family protein [Methanobacterium petrolearium]|uniref:HisA/HisF family protein n=1 Tax=Methanobacterium petrolearium TaxID=710190 RepID=UPI001AE25BBF|nr:HisA/HisF family protein [Methanobacterium petrolearium]MBP1946677.1 phosphoribosylformimino-5-aminoimidazole carboxamide ribotide isomerase [Methanobacterium petrolearium]BDZ70921.1 phosphoribosylformimino-5-aminoimidazole carboxamide ribotide isomerase [Methanobacterium petrolearium]